MIRDRSASKDFANLHVLAHGQTICSFRDSINHRVASNILQIFLFWLSILAIGVLCALHHSSNLHPHRSND